MPIEYSFERHDLRLSTDLNYQVVRRGDTVSLPNWGGLLGVRALPVSILRPNGSEVAGLQIISVDRDPQGLPMSVGDVIGAVDSWYFEDSRDFARYIANKAPSYVVHVDYFSAPRQDQKNPWQHLKCSFALAGDLEPVMRELKSSRPAIGNSSLPPELRRETQIANAGGQQQKPITVAAVATVKAIDTLISLDSRSWMMNRYDRNSARNVRALEASKDGRSGVVYGEYSFNSGQPGWVKLRLDHGNVDCVEFWDYEGQCRPVGQSPGSMLAVQTMADAAINASAGSTSEPSDQEMFDAVRRWHYGDKNN